MSLSPTPPLPHASSRPLWLGYAGTCAVAWLLYVLAGTEFQRGLWQLWQAVYQATLSLWPPMLLGVAVFPWVRRLHAGARRPLLHVPAALAFAAAWQACDFAVSRVLYGMPYAMAVLGQTVLWRAIWGVVAYAAIATAFTAWLESRRARAALLATAQAESALARAELAVISGKLNPHFLFNTLNSLIALTRKDPRAAEDALLRFSGMLRYVLDTKRGADSRVSLGDEIAFVRDYVALESLRLGARLSVDWQLDPDTLDDALPPLSLQPLVENAIQHGIAPRVAGGRIGIRSARSGAGLALSVEDDGAGCEPAALEEPAQGRSGIGLGALRRRFALDYDGQARLQIHTRPGAGFRVDLWIPQTP